MAPSRSEAEAGAARQEAVSRKGPALRFALHAFPRRLEDTFSVSLVVHKLFDWDLNVQLLNLFCSQVF